MLGSSIPQVNAHAASELAGDDTGHAFISRLARLTSRSTDVLCKDSAQLAWVNVCGELGNTTNERHNTIPPRPANLLFVLHFNVARVSLNNFTIISRSPVYHAQASRRIKAGLPYHQLVLFSALTGWRMNSYSTEIWIGSSNENRTASMICITCSPSCASKPNRRINP